MEVIIRQDGLLQRNLFPEGTSVCTGLSYPCRAGSIQDCRKRICSDRKENPKAFRSGVPSGNAGQQTDEKVAGLLPERQDGQISG